LIGFHKLIFVIEAFFVCLIQPVFDIVFSCCEYLLINALNLDIENMNKQLWSTLILRVNIAVGSRECVLQVNTKSILVSHD